MNQILNKIKAQGGRVTKVRKAILEILSRVDCLMPYQELTNKLVNYKLRPNRSTMFRELIFLTSHQIINKNVIGGVDYYEVTPDHHHHLVCVKCHEIKKVDLGRHLAKQEKRIAEQNKFNIINHSLEFYGHCRDCQ